MSRYGNSLSGGTVGMDSIFYVNIGGKRAKITVKATDTLEDIARKINNARDITTPTVPLDVVASVVDGQLVVRSTKTGAGSDGKLSQSITRSGIGPDTFNFYPDLKSEVINGAVVIKKDSTTYYLGLDFDIVGNEIRWRDSDPKAATAGSSYSLGYVPSVNDVLGYDIVRSKTNSADPMHDSIFSNHTFKYVNGKVDLPGALKITYDTYDNGSPPAITTVEYKENIDYIIEGDGIRWLSANRPPDNAAYRVEYTPDPLSGEVWRYPAVTRSALDKPDFFSGYSKLVSVSPSGVTTTIPPAPVLPGQPGADAPTYSTYMKGNGSAVITQGLKTWVEGVDFDIVPGGLGNVESFVRWKTEAGATAPEPGSAYDLKLTYTTTSGANTTTNTYTNRVTRSAVDEFTIDSNVIPFIDPPTGELEGKIYTDNGLEYNSQTFDSILGVWDGVGDYTVTGVANYSTLGAWTSSTFTVEWTPPSEAPTLRAGLPVHGESYTIEYTGNMNMFSFDDNGDGILELLGFDKNHSDPRDTNAQDTQIRLNDGVIRTYSTNTIVFEEKDTVLDDNGNVVSLLGLTLNIKGPGKVQLDVTQDAEKSVMMLQDYIDSYNELMNWINIKMSEKAVDESVKPTLSGDDFRMRWGLLYGDRLLSSAKNKLRDIVSFSQSIAFQSRTGREILYGTLGDTGFRGEGFFTVRLGGAKSTITVDIRLPDGSLKKEEANIGGFAVHVFLSEYDTLESAKDKLNEALKYNYTSDALGVSYYQSVPIYGADGTTIIGQENKLITPSQEIVMGKAEVKNGRIVLTSGFNDPSSEIPLMVQDSSGLLRHLGLNDRYTMLSQVGISTGASTGNVGTNAKSGFLEFDVEKYMEALKTDPESVADLMVSNMKDMDKYLSSLSSSSQAEFASGVVGIEGRVSSAIDQLRQEISGINKYLTNADRRLEAKADALYRAFSAAETNLSKLSQQAAWLASVTNMLSGNNNNA